MWSLIDRTMPYIECLLLKKLICKPPQSFCKKENWARKRNCIGGACHSQNHLRVFLFCFPCLLLFVMTQPIIISEQVSDSPSQSHEVVWEWCCPFWCASLDVLSFSYRSFAFSSFICLFIHSFVRLFVFFAVRFTQWKNIISIFFWTDFRLTDTYYFLTRIEWVKRHSESDRDRRYVCLCVCLFAGEWACGCVSACKRLRVHAEKRERALSVHWACECWRGCLRSVGHD